MVEVFGSCWLAEEEKQHAMAPRHHTSGSRKSRRNLCMAKCKALVAFLIGVVRQVNRAGWSAMERMAWVNARRGPRPSPGYKQRRGARCPTGIRTRYPSALGRGSSFWPMHARGAHRGSPFAWSWSVASVQVAAGPIKGPAHAGEGWAGGGAKEWGRPNACQVRRYDPDLHRQKLNVRLLTGTEQP